MAAVVAVVLLDWPAPVAEDRMREYWYASAAMSAMNFWVARARRRVRGRGVVVGERPARRRWCWVTASGICGGGEGCVSWLVGRVGREGEACF